MSKREAATPGLNLAVKADKSDRAGMFLHRSKIDDFAWNACVATASNRILYGYTWYLDAVLPSPSWRWIGLVLPDSEGNYQAVMPVPLRRKFGRWVVHQPLFCQFLGVFTLDEQVNPDLFFRIVYQRFRYSSTFSLQQHNGELLPRLTVRSQVTHVLNLSCGYEIIYQGYSADRKLNLRRAVAAGWTVAESGDIEPLLTLFRRHHASSINGGVADWAYTILQNLFTELDKRGLATLRYTIRNGRIEAGALFVQEENRIVYLFNAASEAGRQGQARTLLLDQLIREKATQPLWLDFESPEKPSIAAFYRSFGAVEESYWTLQWNRLSRVEKVFRTVITLIK